jgi:hypothetical protein
MSSFKIVEVSPQDILVNDEFFELLEMYCSLLCILVNKKLNFPTIFVHTVQTPEYIEFFKSLCGFDNDIDALREFLKYDNSIITSKFTKKVFNQLQLR